MRLLYTFYLVLLNYTICLACSCIGPFSFCETLARAESLDQSYSIVVGQKNGFVEDEYIFFDIQTVIYGEELDDRVKIEFGYGADCREPTQYWDEDIQYIIILDEPNEDGIHSISICSYAVLKYEQGLVSGLIDDNEEIQVVSYSDFIKKLSCIEFLQNTLDLFVFANDQRQVIIDNQNQLNGTITLQLRDVTGRLILSTEQLLASYSVLGIELPADIPSGIYIAIIIKGTIRQSEKLFL